MNANLRSAMLYTKDGYRRDSMDRFGDDMCELILSYLIFGDKVRLKCVSKQWKRCVFQRHFEVFIDDNKNPLNRLIKVIDNKKELNKQYLESVLEKCSNISIVEHQNRSEERSVITDWSVLSEHEIIDFL